MKIEELKIGDWVNVCDEDAQIKGVIGNGVYFGDKGYCSNIADFIKPIKLTEEWLLKFGFDVNNRPEWINQLSKYEIVCGTTLYLKGSENSVYQIKYVHQLQNLYFALTGNELTLNG